MNVTDILYGTADGIPDALQKGHDALADAASDSMETECRIESAYVWKGVKTVGTSDLAELFRTGKEGLAKAVDLGINVSVSYEILVRTGAVQSEISEKLIERLSDETVPGIAVFIGRVSEERREDVDYCRRAGMTVLLSGEYGSWEYKDGNVFGISDFDVLAINGILAAATVGKKYAEPGDLVSIAKILKKKSGLVVIHTGKPTVLNVLQIFSAAAAGAYIVSDTIAAIPRLSELMSEDMAERALMGRGIVTRKKKSENKRIRRTDTFSRRRAGCTASFISAVYSENEDFSVKVLGNELSESEGSRPLGIRMNTGSSDPAVPYAIVLLAQEALDGIDGVWHSGSGTSFWMRISKDGVKRPHFPRHRGGCQKSVEERLKEEVGVTVSTEPDWVNDGLMESADSSMKKELTDETVESFYTCTTCQTFAPNHICIITPDRPSVCGSVTWTDAAAGSISNPDGPQRPFPKGVLIDPENGEWSGISELMNVVSMGAVERVCLHSLKNPMTSCGCMEAFAVLSADKKSVIIVDRADSGTNPSGISYNDASSVIGRGDLQPGIVGIGRRYLLSPAFLRGDGGIKRISWMGSKLKTLLGESFRTICERVQPGLYDKIADETCVRSSEELAQWISERNHPVVDMPLIE